MHKHVLLKISDKVRDLLGTAEEKVIDSSKSFYKNLKVFSKRNSSFVKVRLKTFWQKYKKGINALTLEIAGFVAQIALYGFAINWILYKFTQSYIPFDWQWSVAFGLAFYFIDSELILWVNKILNRQTAQKEKDSGN